MIPELPGAKPGQDLLLLWGIQLDPRVIDKQPRLTGVFLPKYGLQIGHSLAEFPGVQHIVNLGFSITRLIGD